MTIRILSGLKHLVDGVAASLTAAGVTAEVKFGVRALTQQGGANRIVFVPFDPRSGAGGKLTPPGYVGPREIASEDDPDVVAGTVRALADWERRMLVSVWARDASAPHDELANAVAAEALLEATVRAVHAIGLADVEWSDTTWIVPKENFFGMEIRVGLAFTHPLFEAPIEVGYPENVTINRGE